MSLTDRLSNGYVAADGAQAVDQFAEVRERVHRVVIETLGTGLLANQADEEVIAQQLQGIVEAALGQEETPLSRADRELLAREITDEVVGYGPISRFLKDETVTEIMVNNHREVFIERGGRIFPRTCSSRAKGTSAGSWTRSSRRSAAGSTSPPQWSMRGCRTGRA